MRYWLSMLETIVDVLDVYLAVSNRLSCFGNISGNDNAVSSDGWPIVRSGITLRRLRGGKHEFGVVLDFEVVWHFSFGDRNLVSLGWFCNWRSCTCLHLHSPDAPFARIVSRGLMICSRSVILRSCNNLESIIEQNSWICAVDQLDVQIRAGSLVVRKICLNATPAWRCRVLSSRYSVSFTLVR